MATINFGTPVPRAAAIVGVTGTGDGAVEAQVHVTIDGCVTDVGALSRTLIPMNVVTRKAINMIVMTMIVITRIVITRIVISRTVISVSRASYIEGQYCDGTYGSFAFICEKMIFEPLLVNINSCKCIISGLTTCLLSDRPNIASDKRAFIQCMKVGLTKYPRLASPCKVLHESSPYI